MAKFILLLFSTGFCRGRVDRCHTSSLDLRGRGRQSPWWRPFSRKVIEIKIVPKYICCRQCCGSAFDLSLKNDVNVGTSVLNPDPDPYGDPYVFRHSDPFVRGMDPRTRIRIRIRTKMLRIPTQSTYIHIKSTAVYLCPLVGIGTLPPPLSPASVPLPLDKGWGAHSPAGGGLGKSQF
jgi:hypothetical protein